MGNYQESVNNRVAPLRELDPTPPRQHAFGNPYKLAGGSGSDRDKVSFVNFHISLLVKLVGYREFRMHRFLTFNFCLTYQCQQFGDGIFVNMLQKSV